MELGIHLPNSGPLADGADFVDLAVRAEAAGFDSVWVYDHVLTPASISSVYPRGDGTYGNRPAWSYYDSLTTLSFVAGATRRIKIGTRVLVPVYRNPVVLAKQLATIASLSHDRLLLGVGAGWMQEEFDLVGVPLAERYQRLDEHVRVMRSTWTGHAPAFEGRFYRHPEAGFHPRPARPIPVILGGFGEATLRRIARWGDGWAAVPAPGCADPLDDLSTRMTMLGEMCAEAGRNIDDLIVLGQADMSVDAGHLIRMRELGVTMCDLVPSSPEHLDLARASELRQALASAEAVTPPPRTPTTP